MSLIKIVILALIMILTTKIGIEKASTYTVRLEELNKFKESLCFLKTKIEFTYEPLNEIFKEISSLVYENKENIYKELTSKSIYDESDNSLFLSWQNATKTILNSVKNEDLIIIRNFGKLLGKTDKQGQISEIELTKSLIEKQIKNAEEEKIKNEKLYKSMGIVTGLGICIILI